MSFENPAGAFLWLQSFYNAEKSGVYDSRVYRLDRMKALLAGFNNPHRGIPAIHIAGSKGKGSTASITASILTKAGLKTGLYTSPHLVDYRERITLNGDFFPDSIYIDSISLIQERLPSLLESSETLKQSPPTVFELMTLTAFLVFRAAECDALVLETGLGGRLDATNCIDPVLSVITRIEKEHTEYLGSTLKKIASEKGGIIKPARPVLITRQRAVVRRTLKRIARQQKSPVYLPRRISPIVSHSLERVELEIRGAATLTGDISPAASRKPVRLQTSLPAPGSFQAENSSAAAAAALIFLSAAGLPAGNGTPAKWITSGIAEAQLKGRMEKRAGNLYLDGAHTPVSFAHAVKTFNRLEGKEGTLLFSAVDGKDVSGMIRSIKGCFADVIVTSAGSFRKNDPQALRETVKAVHPEARLMPDIGEALDAARTGGRPVLCSGSFFLVGEVTGLLK